MAPLSVLLVLAAAAIAAGLVLGRRVARRTAEAASAAHRQVVEAIRASAAGECSEIRRAAEIAAREEAMMAGAAFDAVADVRETELSSRRAQLGTRRRDLERIEADLGAAKQRIEAGRARLAGHEAE